MKAKYNLPMKQLVNLLFIALLLNGCSKSTVSSLNDQAALPPPADLLLQKKTISEEDATKVNARFSVGNETFTALQDNILGKMECIRPVFVKSREDKGMVEGVDFVIDDTPPTFSRFDEASNIFITEHPIVDPILNSKTGEITYGVYASAYDTKCGSRNLIGSCSMYNYGHNARRNKFNLDKKNGLIPADAVFPVEAKYISSPWHNCITPNSNQTDMYEQIFKDFILNAQAGDDLVFQMWLQDGAGNSSIKSYRFQKITSLLE